MGATYAWVYFTHGLVDFMIGEASEEYVIEDDEYGCPPFDFNLLGWITMEPTSFKNIQKRDSSVFYELHVHFVTANSFEFRIW